MSEKGGILLRGKRNGSALQEELEGIKGGCPADGIGVIGDGIYDGVENAIDQRGGERLWIIFAIDESRVGLGGGDGGGITEVVFEGVVDVELDAIVGLHYVEVVASEVGTTASVKGGRILQYYKTCLARDNGH